MAVVRPRTRLVNFRVSEAEFQHLQRKSQAADARSVSDYCRDTLLGETPTLEAGAKNNLPEMERRLHKLESILIHLAENLSGVVDKAMRSTA